MIILSGLKGQNKLQSFVLFSCLHGIYSLTYGMITYGIDSMTRNTS